MTFQFYVFLFITLGTLLIGVVTCRAMKGFWQRFLFSALISGIFLYNGVGIAYLEVSTNYLIFYFCFVLALSCSFFFFTVTCVRVSHHTSRVLNQAFSDIDSQRRWDFVIWAYLFLHFVPFLYPEFRLLEFLNPAPPDLTAVLLKRFEDRDVNIFLKIISYVRLLMAPFFYVALFKYRQKITKVSLILLFLLYIQYANQNYIGRSAIGMTILLIFISFWLIAPKYRKYLVILGITLVPFILASFYYYSIIRLGRSVENFNILNAAWEIIYQETSFPIRAGLTIIESGKQVELVSYFKWVLTLPIPKLITGDIAGARLNYEMSEIILGLRMGSPGWFVVLPGIVSESIYIYGRDLFWLHAVFIGFIAAFIVRMVEKSPCLLFLQVHLVLLFFYILNRGGIAAFLPHIVNNFIIFYIFIFLLVFNPTKNKKIRIFMKKNYYSNQKRNNEI